MPRFTILWDPAEQTEERLPDGRLIRSLRRDELPGVESRDLDDQEIQEITTNPQARALAPEMPVQLIRPTGNDMLDGTSSPWGISAIGADKSPYTGEGVTVAILDTGIRTSHQAFRHKDIRINDLTIGHGEDGHGHGTHCSATLLGQDCNGTRIGVARGVERVLVGKVLDDKGRGTSQMIFRGLHWAIQEGANIISMSLGLDFPGAVANLVKQDWPVDLAACQVLEDYRKNVRMFNAFMQLARRHSAFGEGAVVIAAAGNESRIENGKQYRIAASVPATAEGVLSVGAIAQAGKDKRHCVAPFSNRFPQFVAPGVGILSASITGGLVGDSGTSMACPHVAGVAALWMQKLRSEGSLNIVDDVIAHLVTSARIEDINEHTSPADRGRGLITAPT